VVHALDEWQRRILHLTHNNTHNCHRERERATALPDLWDSCNCQGTECIVMVAADQPQIEGFVRWGVQFGLYRVNNSTPTQLINDSDDSLSAIVYY